MKKVNKLFIPLFLALTFFGGCNKDDDKDITVASMAGVFNFTKATLTEGGITATVVPPNVSGTLTLTSTGQFAADLVFEGDHVTDSGTFTVSDPTIVLHSGDGSQMAGRIEDDGDRIIFTQVEGATTITMEFNRS